ncbi:hypothetical protein OG21DRAFT_1004789 [Imleria badia]|nr:hypothetical protein OG21DRAFT_1004789 [Imleria badia]
MSLLTFLGLRQPKYNRAPLTLADILHRTFVTGLAGLSIYGIYLGYSVHDHVMTKGKGTRAERGRGQGTRRGCRGSSRTVLGRGCPSCTPEAVIGMGSAGVFPR